MKHVTETKRDERKDNIKLVHVIFVLLFRTNKLLACAGSDVFEIDKFLDKKSAALQIENVSACTSNMLAIGNRQRV